jgi:hypothetical protein
MKRSTKIGLSLAAAVALAATAGTSGAVAAKLITSAQIQDGTIKSVDLSDGLNNKLNKTGEQGPKGDQGPAGKDGVKGDKGDKGDHGVDGKDGLDGAVYRVATYKNGGAGDATVACADTDAESMTYTAIAGGVQAGGVQSKGQTSEFDVAASFPGRMDWTSGKPKEDRLDGWIVLGSGGYSSTLRVWALCVPNDSIPVDETVYDN